MAATDKIIRIILRMKDEMSGQLNKTSGRLKKLGGQMQSLGVGMSAAITAPVVGAGVAMFKAFAEFEDVMAEMQARTGATAEEMEQMGDLAKQMGRDTVFSATEAAEAMLELTSSGSSAAEAMEQLPPVLDLAAAGALDLGVAADGVTDIMKQFQLEAGDAAAISDELARAAGSSSATVNDLLQGFSNVGPVASQFGFSVNETAATLATFAENGVKGAEAGTQLRSMLLNMTRDTAKTQGAWAELGVSMFDAAGNIRPINDVFLDINAAMEDMPMEDQIRIGKALAGAYGIIGFNALRASNGIGSMQQNMLNAAGASEVAQARMDTLAGRWKSFMGSLETLGITLGELGAGPVGGFLEMMTNIVNAIAEWAENNPRLAQTVMLVVGALATLGPILIIVGTLISSIGTIITAVSTLGAIVPAAAAGFGALSAVIPAVGAAIAALTGPIGIAIAAIGALVLAWKADFLGIRTAVGNLKDAIQRDMQTMAEGGKHWTAILRDNLKMLFQIIVELGKKALGPLFDIGKNIIMALWEGIKANFGPLVDAVKGVANRLSNAIKNVFRISSPSQVTLAMGEQIGAGLTLGMGQGIVQGMKGTVIPAINGILKTAQEANNRVLSVTGVSRGSRSTRQTQRQIRRTARAANRTNNGILSITGVEAGTESLSAAAARAARRAGERFKLNQLVMGETLPSINSRRVRQAAGGDVNIQNMMVPPGTTREQAQAIMREIAKEAKRRGARGGG